MQNTLPGIYGFLTFLTLFILLIGTFFYHYIEGFSWIDAFYFCVVTLATVGYGDIAPKTDAGKIFTVFYILMGAGIIGAFAKSFFERAKERREKLREKNKAN
jgi:hypothetical protein